MSSIQQSEINVAIAGGGPAGLVAAILLAQIGIKSTVLESSVEPDQWSTKSYTIVIGEKGQASLKRAGCLEAAANIGMLREKVYFYDGKTGQVKGIPKGFKGLGFSRPLLVDCLEKEALKSSLIRLKRGSRVSQVIKDDDKLFHINFEDGATLSGISHVIGADGKWSKIRDSFPSLSKQATIKNCPSFGVHMMSKSIPEGFSNDGTYVVKPSGDCSFYIIAAFVPTGEMSISMVCYDETVKRYPWLEPPANLIPEKYGSGGWKDEYSCTPSYEQSDPILVEKLSELFKKELPMFWELLDKETFLTARKNRYVSWLQMNGVDGKDVSYTTDDGKVALIGDAAHAVTPSMGEGANTAMESAVKLVESVESRMKENNTDICTVEIMDEAFRCYGLSRPKETQPIQEKSAAASSGMRR